MLLAPNAGYVAGTEILSRMRRTKHTMPNAAKSLSILGALTTILLAAEPLWAEPGIAERELDRTAKLQQDSDIGFRRGSVIVAPIPFSNPVLGAGIALGGGYLFKLGVDEETSFIGLGALGSDNGSRAYGFSTSLAFASGWNFDLTVAEADLRYDLFVESGTVPLLQDGVFASAGFSRDLSESWRAGMTFRYIETGLAVNGGGLLPGDLRPESDLEIASLGLTLDWDIRDSSDYPTQGARLSISASQAAVLGDSRDYSFASANLDSYRPLGPKTVLAARGSVCATSDGAPFFDKCSIGFSDAFRGFSPTLYYDNRLVSGQLELRQRLNNRFGVVVFGGVGWTGTDFGSLNEEGSRIAGGAGLRYRLSKSFPIDFSVDYTANNEGENFLYLYVGQRF
jgi:outer membrane protein assembly factor BamA